MIIKELFVGKYVGTEYCPVSLVDGYKYRPDQLTAFEITIDEEKGGINFFTLGERK